MRLAELQRQLLAGVLDGDESICAHLREQGGRSAQRALAIQRGSVRGIQQQALAHTYPVLARLLGERSFANMAREFLKAHPAHSNDLHELGRELASWLQAFTPLADWGYLSDVARLEWAWHEVFHAAGDVVCDWQALAALPEAQQARCSLQMPQASRLLSSPYPIVTIWNANQPDAETDHVDIDAGGSQQVLVLRKAAAWPSITVLEAADYALLQAVQEGTPLGELSALPEAEQRLSQAIQRGWISSFQVRP